MTDFVAGIDANPPHWANSVIGKWEESKLRLYGDFLYRHYWTDQGSINVFCIRGTDHPDYQHLTWHEFLHRGKRMDRNVPMLERNPGYYLETERKKPAMYYNSYDGIDWYIGADGNHRSCLARFYFHDRGMAYLHGVHLNHYQFNGGMLTVFQALREELYMHAAQGFPMTLSSGRVHLRREDTAGWKTDTYSTTLDFSVDERCRDDAVRLKLGALAEPLEITRPAEGWELLLSLMMWRDKRLAAARPGFLRRMTRWGRP